MIAVACADGTVRVFAAGNGRTLALIQATNTGFVSGAEFSPDSKSIVVGVDAGNTGDVQVWNAELATSPLPVLERIARQRDTQKLTAAQLQQILNGADG
jgi:WD40 repeat protein